MSNIVVITGASSGFGALTARALADASNVVHAGMRETTGRNAPAVRAAAGVEASMVSQEIARIVALPAGRRPFRVHIDPADDGSEEVSLVADRVRRELLVRVGLADLLAVRE